jgi:hypothetical protein
MAQYQSANYFAIDPVKAGEFHSGSFSLDDIIRDAQVMA